MTLLTDGMFYLITGVLTAGGDTRYPTIVEVATLWIIVVLPTGLMYFTETLKSIRIAYTLIPITGFLNVGLIYLRYKKLKWYKQLVDEKN
jgi:Na+-driven multidrug efflux pump